MLSLLFWLFVVPAGAAALLSVRTGRRYLEYVEGELRAPEPDMAGEEEGAGETEVEYLPAVSLILPVKGLDNGLAENLTSLAGQDYPDFELLIVSRDAGDPAVQAARTVLGDRARFVVAGEPPEGTGEKVHNLTAAVDAARPESEVLAFADSDGQVRAGWLRALVAPLADESVGATTGFRWHFPSGGDFWSLLRSVWDSTIAGNMSPKDSNFAWGGATAIRRETFDTARVLDFWRGTVSDDYRLSAAVNAAQLGIRFVPGAMVATTGNCGAREFLRWATRQMIITKVYRRKLWLAGFVAHIFYCGAMLASLLMLLFGEAPWGFGGLVLTIVPGMGKGGMRGYVARLMFPEREDWLDRFGWAYFWMVPIATWTWLYVFAASALTRRIEWGGYIYELVSAEKTRVVRS